MRAHRRTPSAPLVACAALTALMSLAPPGAQAQESPTLTEGQRIRLTSTDRPNGRYEAEVVAIAGDSVRLRRRQFAGNRWSTEALPLSSITSLQVPHGRKSNVGKGAMIGGIVGASFGLVAGIAATAREDRCPPGEGFCIEFEFGPETIPAAALGGALLGAGVGTVIGALTPGTKWVDVPVRGVRLEAAPTVAGLRIALPVGR